MGLRLLSSLARMNTLVANLVGRIQHKTKDGKSYLVAPLSLIVPGVLNGSKGPLYYSPEEIAKSVDLWNGQPLVVYHPTLNGTPISAQTEGVLDASGIGTVQNAQVDKNGRLLAEGWFDEAKTATVDHRILFSLQESRQIELSTGLAVDNELAPEGSSIGGKSYTHIARNYRPDHLAILPDQVGACSIQDGCGVLMNKEDGDKKVVNELSNDTVRQLLTDQLNSSRSSGLGDNPNTIWVEDTFQNRVIYRDGDKTFSLGFTKSGEKVKLASGAPTEVVRVTRWKNVTNTESSKENSDMALSPKERTAIIDNLIANTCCYVEDDREILSNMEDEMLELVANKSLETAKKIENAEAVSNAAKKGFEDADGTRFIFNTEGNAWKVETKKTETEEAVNEDKKEEKPMTDQEWMESAPPGIRSAVQNAMVIEAKEKTEIVNKLVANLKDEEKTSLTEVLNAKPLVELRTLSFLTPQKTVSQPNYVGQATPEGIVDNTVDDEDMLLPTVLNVSAE